MTVNNRKIGRGRNKESERKPWQTVAYSLSFAALLFICAIIHTTCLSFFGKAPALTLAIVCAIGFIMGEKYGAVWGIVGGVITDFLGSSGFSLSPVLFMICGYFCGALVGWFLSKNIPSFLVYAAISGIIREIFTLIYYIIFSNGFSPFKVFTGTVLPEYLAYLLCVFPAYFAVLVIFSLFKGKDKRENKKIGKSGYSGQVMAEFQAKHLSRKSQKRYDVAIGFLEGWSDRYVAFCVQADKKIGWMHNTFANIAAIPHLETCWMDQVGQIVFVADNCTKDFCVSMPDMADKAVTILNITDSQLIQKRANQEPCDDEAYIKMKNACGFKLVTVCRASIYHKGLDRIVWCAKKLKDAGREFLWTIVGDGPDFDTVQNMINEHGLSEQVVMIGNRLNPLPFIKLADAFCMPSRYEGKPMVITESMILGTPPFVTNYLSAYEQIKNGIDGVIVENADDTMFEAIDKYIENPDLLIPMREHLLSHEYGNSEYMREIEEKFLDTGI